jgi:hypothetical protein
MPAKRKTKRKTTTRAAPGQNGLFHRLPHVKGLFKFSRKQRCFVYNGMKLRGVCPFVKSALIDVYRSIPRAGDGVRGDDSDAGNETRYASKLKGAARGSYVHRQIRAYAAATTQKRTGMKLHRLTREIIQYIDRAGWTLVDGDVPAWWLQVRIGTCVDLVCRTREGTFVLIEIKTGYHGDAYTREFGSVSKSIWRDNAAPPLKVDLRVMHLLQLISTVILFNKAHPHYRVGAACVLHADGTTVNRYDLPTSLLTRRPAIETAMLSHS